MTEDPPLNSVNSVRIFAFDIFKPVPVTSSSAESFYLLASASFLYCIRTGLGSGEWGGLFILSVAECDFSSV